MVYYLNYRPECPEVADFGCFYLKDSKISVGVMPKEGSIGEWGHCNPFFWYDTEYKECVAGQIMLHTDTFFVTCTPTEYYVSFHTR